MLPATIVAQFVKIWDKNTNYTGEAYDIFDDKIRYFLDTCYTVAIKHSQFHAIFSSILSGRAKDYFVYNVNRNLTFAEMYTKMKTKFDTEVNKAQYHTNWSLMTYSTLRAEKSNIGKSNLEVLQVLLDKLQLCQRALGLGYMGEKQLIATVQRACRGVSELKFALFTPTTTFEKLSSKLRSSIMTNDNRNAANVQYFTDRRFGRHDRGDQYNKGNNTYNCYNNNNNGRKPWRGKCYVCGKEGCRSNKHSDDEQQKAKELWRRNREFRGDKGKYNTFLADYEGDSDDDIDDVNEEANHSEDNDKESSQYIMAAYLSNKLFMNLLTAQDTFLSNKANTTQHFVLDQYVETIFQGIMPDTGATKVSTPGKSQFKVLQREMPEIKLDITRANEATICFESGMPLSSINTVQLLTLFGIANFHVVDTSTPFLFCLKNMDIFGIYLNNITNQLICQDGKNIQSFANGDISGFLSTKTTKLLPAYFSQKQNFVKFILALGIYQSTSCISC